MTRKPKNVTLKCVLVVTTEGDVITLDLTRIQLVDKQSKMPLFKEAKYAGQN